MSRPSARERILTTAYDLFLQQGTRAVGINEIISAANVAKATFYAHFPSKDDLVLAFLERRRALFTVGYVSDEIHRRGGTPEDQLLAIFDIMDEWFQAPGFTGCPYIRALLDMGPDSQIGQASIGYLQEIRSTIEDTARSMDLEGTEEFASSWVLLMQGAVISSVAIDAGAARRAGAMARQLIKAHTPAATGRSVVFSDS